MKRLIRKFKVDDFNDDTYQINFSIVAKDNKLLSVTRLLASQMMHNSYLTVGDFLKDLSNNDLEIITDIIDFGEDHENFGDMILMSEMLATGEGLASGDTDEVTRRVNQFMVMISIESLYRKGYIQIFHENMSFGEDMLDKIVAKKIDD